MNKIKLTDGSMRKRVIDVCKIANVIYYFNPDSRKCKMAGFPDLCLIPVGKGNDRAQVYFVELKTDDDRLSEEQYNWLIRIIHNTNDYGFVVRGEDGLDHLEQALLYDSLAARLALTARTTAELNKVEKRVEKRYKSL